MTESRQSREGVYLTYGGPLGWLRGRYFDRILSRLALTPGAMVLDYGCGPGDFVLIGKEVNPVIQALRKNGIEVTALHSHMLDEQPRLFFMHFWANDDAVKLAKGLRAALDETASQKGK